MSELYFKNVVEIGNLYLEKVLNQFEDENIIFICHDKKGVQYLCLCYEFRFSLKWIICEVSPDSIINLLLKNVDILSVFKLQENNLIQIIYKDGEEESEKVSMDSMGNNIFPPEKVFLQPDTDISKYLYYLCVCFGQKATQTYELNLDYNVEKLNTVPLKNVEVVD